MIPPETVSRSGTKAQVQVYYDGLCHLCSREIEHYKKMSGSHRIRFVDITSSRFDAAAEGLDPQAIHRSLHARDADGRVWTGVDAFLVIWSELDLLRRIVPVASAWPVKRILEAGYVVFAKIRPALPRKSCSDSPYCEF